MRTIVMLMAMLLVPVVGWGEDRPLHVVIPEYAVDVGPGVNEGEEPIRIIVDSIGMLMADKKMVLRLLEEANIQGGELNIALYEYDEQNQVWNRARPASCLVKMQAAMLAMDTYYQQRVWSMGVTQDRSLQDKWETAKRECLE